jgi:putative phage-type endonuclease
VAAAHDEKGRTLTIDPRRGGGTGQLPRRTSDLGDRTQYLGATDIAAIVGVSPWAAPIDVYRSKVEGTDKDAGNAARLGLLLEPIIVEEYERQEGVKTRRLNEVTHRAHPYIKGHPDRIVVGTDGIMDAKAYLHSQREWGEPGTADVPPHVTVQMQVYMGLMGRAWADVVLFSGSLPLKVYRVPADPVLYDQLIVVAMDFWERHVLLRVPPVVDDSASYRRYLEEKFPRGEDKEVVATPETALLVDEWADLMAQAADIDKRIDLVRNRIIETMADATVLLAPGGRVTNKPVPRADDGAILRRLAEEGGHDLDALRAESKAQWQGHPTVRLWPTKRKEPA